MQPLKGACRKCTNTDTRKPLGSNGHQHESEAPQVFHHDQWLMDEANESARLAGMPAPFPERVKPSSDNGERFFADYFREQLAREEQHDYTSTSLRNCPCGRCSLRRTTCRCEACSKSRGESNIVTELLSPAGSATTLRAFAARGDVRLNRRS